MSGGRARPKNPARPYIRGFPFHKEASADMNLDALAEAALQERKKDLRRQLLARRAALIGTAQGDDLARTLRGNLSAVLENATGLLASRTRPGEDSEEHEVACYFPMDSEWDFGALSNRDWLYPRVARPGELAWFRRGDSPEEWPRGAFGIREAPPESCVPCDASARKPWIVIVPALACDDSHVRLGYGGGFYDRFLARHGAHVLSVCCVPTCLRPTELPRGPFDVPVDVVVDERGVHLRPRSGTTS